MDQAQESMTIIILLVDINFNEHCSLCIMSQQLVFITSPTLRILNFQEVIL